jgi:hypothetical protein
VEGAEPRGVHAAVSKWKEDSRRRHRFDLCISDGVRDMVESTFARQDGRLAL